MTQIRPEFHMFNHIFIETICTMGKISQFIAKLHLLNKLQTITGDFINENPWFEVDAYDLVLFCKGRKPEFQSLLEKNLKVIWKNESHFERGSFDELSRRKRIKLIAHTVILLECSLPRHGLTRI